MNVVVDPEGLRAVAGALRDAATDVDGATAGAPSSVDAGLASDLLGTILATTADAVARLAYESDHLATLTDDCNDAFAAADDSAADSLAALSGDRP